ncbi:Phosphate regulon sensor protein PhoR (SphS) [Chitinispirillum alkaliphilum]|nr:Phosphate regulon sensor protein PhoR (SphS) [Chitinispirillum alkaliphilum]
MKLRPIFWQLFPSYCLLTVGSLLVIILYLSSVVENFYFKQTATNSAERISLVQDRFTRKILAREYSELDDLTKKLGRVANMRFTVILPDGRVIADTDEMPRLMDNHLNRPEVQSAFDKSMGISNRYSHTVDKNMQYSAKVIKDEQDITIAILRAAVPVDSIRRSLKSVNERAALMGLILVLVTAMISLWISRYMSDRIKHLQHGAQHFAKGDLFHKLSGSGALEFEMLAVSMNNMAKQLNDRLNTITTQRNEQKTILESMTEGVLAIGTDNKIININKPAAEILDIDPTNYKGKYVQESIRNSEIHRLIKRLTEKKYPIEEELELFAPDETVRHLQIHGTLLNGVEKQTTGVLLVMNDITRLKKLEKMRQDFAANVSHELRTPLTSIKGFIETILSGAKDNPHDTERFLKIVNKHVNRLESIIEDLLNLAKIEKETEKSEIALSPNHLYPICQRAAETCHSSATEKNITLKIDGNSKLQALSNPFMLEQALVNLIDNAIKYSTENTTVQIVLSQNESNSRIEIIDQGIGIDRKYLPRVFERFYRVDKARSRKVGGTGLGLSIVRHIILAHSGTISVKSKPGKGSTFTIELPKA